MQCIITGIVKIVCTKLTHGPAHSRCLGDKLNCYSTGYPRPTEENQKEEHTANRTQESAYVFTVISHIDDSHIVPTFPLIKAPN